MKEIEKKEERPVYAEKFVFALMTLVFVLGIFVGVTFGFIFTLMGLDIIGFEIVNR